METLGALVSTLWDLARALFGAFGEAVAAYPLVTLLCVAAAAYVYVARHGRWASIRRWGFFEATDLSDWLEILGLFIAVTIVASGVGFVVHGLIEASVWTAQKLIALLGFGVDLGGEVVRPFADAPLAFLAALAASVVAATLLGMRRSAGAGLSGARRASLGERARGAWRAPRGLLAAALCLVFTYVVATVAATIDAGVEAAGPPAAGSGTEAAE
jgi:hypothetical protein